MKLCLWHSASFNMVRQASRPATSRTLNVSLGSGSHLEQRGQDRRTSSTRPSARGHGRRESRRFRSTQRDSCEFRMTEEQRGPGRFTQADPGRRRPRARPACKRHIQSQVSVDRQHNIRRLMYNVNTVLCPFNLMPVVRFACEPCIRALLPSTTRLTDTFLLHLPSKRTRSQLGRRHSLMIAAEITKENQVMNAPMTETNMELLSESFALLFVNALCKCNNGPGLAQSQHFLMDNLCRGAVPANTVSTEEQQIRDELEAEIEEDLEREIINEMCRLARHLQRLYQQKDRREITSSPNYICQLPLSHTANAVLSEMNIRIKLDGRCKINVTKVEQDAAAIQPRSYPNTDQSEKRQGSTKTRQSDTVYHRKQQNHPVVPWR